MELAAYEEENIIVLKHKYYEVYSRMQECGQMTDYWVVDMVSNTRCKNGSNAPHNKNLVLVLIVNSNPIIE
jgi:hypothetical protein